MSNNGYQTPDLASILRTLAAATQQYQAVQQPSTQPPPQSGDQNVQVEGTPHISTGQTPAISEPEDEYDPSNPLLPISPASGLQSSDTITVSPQARSLLQPPSSQPVTRTPTPSIDPRSITTYPAALRHITQNLALNPAVMGRIRKLIASQHQHERQWWEGRERLIKQQREREEGRRKVDDVLKNLGSIVPAPVAGPTPEEDAAELSRYDRKVHRACGEMINATATELQALGIPFFGIRSELLVQEGEVVPHGTKKLKWEELKVLQRRVLDLLEDLCAE